MVALICQRCLEPMELLVHATIDLALLHKEEHAERLPEDADYLVVEEQDVVLAEIIEDELLLNISFYADAR